MSANILVLNLTRIGDLIQTSPLIRGLRLADPDCRITMLANVKFAGIVSFIEGVDDLVEFDIRQFGMPDGAEPDVLAIYDYLDELTGRLRSRAFDRIINLSHTKLSAMLAKLIDAPDIRGFGSTPRGMRLIRDPWLIYFSSFLNFRRMNRFNLVDLYIRGAGVEPDEKVGLNLAPDMASVGAFKDRMAGRGVEPGDLLIGVQAGASREDRRWSPKSFAAVADRLVAERNAKVVLFGAASEKNLGDEVAAAMTEPAINLIGATSLGELTLWVKHLNLLITNDTGAMHIAAAVGAPILALFFAHARAEETGPYCGGAVVLQSDIDCAPCSHHTVCGHMSCLDYITPDDVSAAALMILDGAGEALDTPGLFARTRVYRSRFHADHGVDFVPVKRAPLDKSELFAYLYRPVFNEALSRWNEPEQIDISGAVGDAAINDLSERFLPAPEGAVEKWAMAAIEGAGKLSALCEKGEALTAELAGPGGAPNAGRLQQIGAGLADIDRSIAVLAGVHEALCPLTSVYRRRAENFEGDDPAELARQAGRAHRWLKTAATLFSNVTRRALDTLTTKPRTQVINTSKGKEP